MDNSIYALIAMALLIPPAVWFDDYFKLKDRVKALEEKNEL